MEQVEAIELEEFIHESIRQIESAVGDRSVKDAIEFEVLVTQTKKADGALKIYVASGQTALTTERVQKISFKVFPDISPGRLKKMRLRRPKAIGPAVF